MTRQILRFGRGSVTRKTGDEGPRHDPYSFTEITVVIGQDTFVAHLGLREDLEVNGARTIWTAEEIEPIFKNLTGFSVREWESFFDRYEAARYRVMTPRERYEAEMIEEFDQRMLSYAY